MSKGYLVESDVENLALDTLGEVGYNVFKSPSPTTPNAKIDAMRRWRSHGCRLTGKD